MKTSLLAKRCGLIKLSCDDMCHKDVHNWVKYSLSKLKTRSIAKLLIVYGIVIIYALPGMLYAQEAIYKDSITQSYSRSNKLHPVLSSDNHYSFFHGNLVSFLGLKAGLAWDRHEIGLGLVGLFSKVSLTENREGKVIDGHLVFRYVDAYYEYRFFKGKKWQIDLPMVTMGMGKAGVSYPATNKDGLSVIMSNRTNIVFIEPTAAAYYKVMPYTSIGLGGGYRFAFSKDANASRAFSAPILIARLRIDFGSIFKDYVRGNRRR